MFNVYYRSCHVGQCCRCEQERFFIGALFIQSKLHQCIEVQQSRKTGQMVLSFFTPIPPFWQASPEKKNDFVSVHDENSKLQMLCQLHEKMESRKLHGNGETIFRPYS